MHKRCLPLIGLPVLALFLSGAGPIGETSVPNLAALKAIPTTQSKYVFRQGYNVAGDGGEAAYVPSTLACTKNTGAGDNISEVRSVNGKCWLGVFPNGEVNILAAGADPTGVADSAPAINAAFLLGSNHTFVFPPGTYTIKSNSTSPYPIVMGPIGIRLSGTDGAHYSNIKVVGHKATITVDNATANSNYWLINNVDHLTVEGLNIQGNTTGLTAGAGPSAIILTKVTDFDFSNLGFPGWGGATADPAPIRGDWLTNGRFHNLDMPASAQGFDLAYLKTVQFSNIRMVGAGNGGSGVSPYVGISIAYDDRMQTNYPGPFATTTGVTIGPGVDISNFSQALLIRAGSGYQIIGTYLHDNPSGGGFYNPGAGLMAVYESASCCSSSTDPVKDVTFTGNTVARNGAGGSGCGVYLDPTLSSGVAFDRFTFVGNHFDDNTNTGICAPSATNLTNVFVGDNGYTGSNQTTRVGANILKSGIPNIAWTPVDASGAALTFTGVSTAANLNGNLVTISFSLAYPATGSGANATFSSLPFTAANANYAFSPTLCYVSGGATAVVGRMIPNSAQLAFYNAATGANMTNANLSSLTVQCNLTYPTK
jgi:hypothetical protein